MECLFCGKNMIQTENQNVWVCPCHIEPSIKSTKAKDAVEEINNIKINDDTMEAKEIVPSKMPCPKCGGKDINRAYTEPGTIELSGTDSTKRKNDYVSIDGWLDAKCIKECIMSHCRTCQYDWEIGVLS